MVSRRFESERVPNKAIRARAATVDVTSVRRVVVKRDSGEERFTDEPKLVEAILIALRGSDRLASVPLEPGQAEDERGRIQFQLIGGDTVAFRFHPADLAGRWGAVVVRAIDALPSP